MTERYFAEKQLRRYPLKSAAYFIAAFFFAVILVLFGAVSISLREIKKIYAAENPLDCVVVSADCGASPSALAEIKNVRRVERVYLSKSVKGEIRLSPERKLPISTIRLEYCEEGLPEVQANAFLRENGRSPILCGRDIRAEDEAILHASVLIENGVPEEEFSSFLGSSVVCLVANGFTMEYEEKERRTIVGIADAAFAAFSKSADHSRTLFVRAPATKRAEGYLVYPKSGMLRAVFESLSDRFGEDSVRKWLENGEANGMISSYVALFDRIFVFMSAILAAAFLGVTIFTVVIYTEKQAEFHRVAAAFGARRRTLVLSEILFYLVLLFVAVLLSCLVSVLFQSGLLKVLSGYFEATLGSVSVLRLFAAGGGVFGFLSLCVIAGVLLGTVAVKKRNL